MQMKKIYNFCSSNPKLKSKILRFFLYPNGRIVYKVFSGSGFQIPTPPTVFKILLSNFYTV